MAYVDAALRNANEKKRKKPVSTVRKALELCKAKGWHGGVVERFNAHSKTRHDLFGFIDLIVMTGDRIIGVQCATASGFAAHRHKIAAEPRHTAWLSSGGIIELWIVGKKKVKRGGKAFRYTLERHVVESVIPASTTGESA